MKRLFGILAMAVVVVTACDPVGPVDEQQRQDLLSPETPLLSGSLGQTTEELIFARYMEGMGPAEVDSRCTPLPCEIDGRTVSFTVVAGQTSTLVIPYSGQPSGPPLFEFRLGPGSLLTHPDGSPVLPGQSVTITVTPDPDRLIFRFGPRGLTFSPADPARLLLNYEHTDPDANGDDVVNFLDSALQLRFRIWRQDGLQLPWVQIPTIRVPQGEILDGRITHFTGFAMAS